VSNTRWESAKVNCQPIDPLPMVEAVNLANLAQCRASDKALGKFYKRTLAQAMALKGKVVWVLL